MNGKENGGKRSTTRYGILLRIMQAANDKLDPKNVVSTIMDSIKTIIPCEAWSLLLLHQNGNELVFERARGKVADRLARAKLKVGEGIAGWVALHEEPVIVNNVSLDPRFNSSFDQASNFKTRSILCVPLISRGKLIGVVELINRKVSGYRFTRRDLTTLTKLLGPIAVSLHNALLFQETEKLAITDDLTKLYNTRYVHSKLGRMIEERRSTRERFSLIFLDLDGFKTVNDRYGHLIGAKTLVEIGKIIFSTVGEKDEVARYGGDEFVVLMPGADAIQSREMAERIRHAIVSHDFLAMLPADIKLSASFGISVYPDHADTLTELIQKADNAMYAVKYSGKNAVQLAH
ncbi:MAG: diguanylate cyclase [Acidobacteriota bacterium]